MSIITNLYSNFIVDNLPLFSYSFTPLSNVYKLSRTGLLLVSAIDPGKVTVARQASETHQDPKYKDDKSSVLDVISDMIKNIVPKNMISMSHMKTKTVYKPGEKPDEQAVEGMNMLGVIA